MYLWIAVTSDQYELPIAVEKTASALAVKLGTSEHYIRNSLDVDLKRKRWERNTEFYIRRVKCSQ